MRLEVQNIANKVWAQLGYLHEGNAILTTVNNQINSLLPSSCHERARQVLVRRTPPVYKRGFLSRVINLIVSYVNKNAVNHSYFVFVNSVLHTTVLGRMRLLV